MSDLERYYQLGIQHERERVAAALYELDLHWGRSAEQVYHDRKAEMMRLFETCAHRFHERELGRAYMPCKGVSS